MSRNGKPTSKSKPAKTPPAAAAPDDDGSEFLTPEDIVGEDLAAQLQVVLDEAKQELNLDLTKPSPPATCSDDGAFAEPEPPSEDDFTDVDAVLASAAGVDAEIAREPVDAVDAEAEFETPGQVLGDDAPTLTPEEVEAQVMALADAALASVQPAPAQATAAPVIDDDTDAFEAQLKELLAMAESGGAEAASAPATPAPSIQQSLDATVTAAKSVSDEADQMTRMIEEAIAPTPVSTPAPASPPASSATMKQLDEFLAGHADHAVADEFETVQDVVSQATAAQSPVTAPIDQLTDVKSAVDDDEFDSPEQLLLSDATTLKHAPAAPAKVKAKAPEARQPVVAPPASAAHGLGDAVAMASALQTPASEHDQAETATSADAHGRLTRVVIKVRDAAYRSCAILNRPLLNASATTRRNIGMIGLITLANASILFVGKLLNLWG